MTSLYTSGSFKDKKWVRSGISVLWDSKTLSSICNAPEVVSIRELFHFFKHGWPEDLPSVGGDTIIAAGLDTCMDILEPERAIEWMEVELYRLLLSFQEEYNGQAGLIFWLPEGLSRIQFNVVDSVYEWCCISEFRGSTIPISRCLWNGAQKDCRRMFVSDGGKQSKETWIGLYHPRIS